MPKGYVPKGNPMGDFLGDMGSRINDLYRSGVDWYNSKVSAVQGYIRNDPIESEEDFEVYSLLSQLGVPRNEVDDLLAYMERNGLDWSDLQVSKVLALYGGRANSVKTLNFVSRNVGKLYR